MEVSSSLQLLQALHAMRALRTMHAMQPGRGVCNDAITSPIVTGPSSWVIGESSLVTDCRCTRGCNDDLVISHYFGNVRGGAVMVIHQTGWNSLAIPHKSNGGVWGR